MTEEDLQHLTPVVSMAEVHRFHLVQEDTMTEEDLQQLTPVASMAEVRRLHLVQENGATKEAFLEAGKILDKVSEHHNTTLRTLEALEEKTPVHQTQTLLTSHQATWDPMNVGLTSLLDVFLTKCPYSRPLCTFTVTRCVPTIKN